MTVVEPGTLIGQRAAATLAHIAERLDVPALETSVRKSVRIQELSGADFTDPKAARPKTGAWDDYESLGEEITNIMAFGEKSCYQQSR